jgi:hypothetical protein
MPIMVGYELGVCGSVASIGNLFFFFFIFLVLIGMI